MSTATIAPVAKALYLCDGHIGVPGAKTDLVGLFDGIAPAHYPHRQKYFVVYARLLQGLGQVPFYVDIRYAPTRQLVHVSGTHTLVFPDQHTLVEMALTVRQTWHLSGRIALQRAVGRRHYDASSVGAFA